MKHVPTFRLWLIHQFTFAYQSKISSCEDGSILVCSDRPTTTVTANLWQRAVSVFSLSSSFLHTWHTASVVISQSLWTGTYREHHEKEAECHSIVSPVNCHLSHTNCVSSQGCSSTAKVTFALNYKKWWIDVCWKQCVKREVIVSILSIVCVLFFNSAFLL